jgi:hypothetical protein
MKNLACVVATFRIFSASLAMTLSVANCAQTNKSTRPSTANVAATENGPVRSLKRKPICLFYFDTPIGTPDRENILLSRDKFYHAWQDSLASPADILTGSWKDPGLHTLPPYLKMGQKGWVDGNGFPGRIAQLCAQASPELKWVFYNPEGGRNAGFYVRGVSTIRKVCDDHGWKLAYLPDGRGLWPDVIKVVAPMADAYLSQAQKHQQERNVPNLRAFAAAVRAVNPKCLVGTQLGVDNPKYGSPYMSAVAMYMKTRDFLDLYTVWYSDGNGYTKFLQTIEALEEKGPAPTAPVK